MGPGDASATSSRGCEHRHAVGSPGSLALRGRIPKVGLPIQAQLPQAELPARTVSGGLFTAGKGAMPGAAHPWANRMIALGRSPHVPSLAEPVVRGMLGFTIVSVAGFAPWAIGGRALHHAVGEIGLYAACAFVFIVLSGLFLHRLIIGPGSLVRFYLLFTAAFLAYAACWTLAWMSLRGHLGSVIGLLFGTAVMSWMLVCAIDTRRDFLKAAVVLFALNAVGYFTGGWVEAEIGRLRTIHLFGLTFDRRSTLTLAMLAWGVCYGIGFGAALGLAFYFCQAKARAHLRQPAQIP